MTDHFPSHLRSDDETAQRWTVDVDEQAKVEFPKLSVTEIRRRQSLCIEQIKRAMKSNNHRALIDLERQEHALMREMLNRV